MTVTEVTGAFVSDHKFAIGLGTVAADIAEVVCGAGDLLMKKSMPLAKPNKQSVV
jgi:hypothetical protein